VQGRARALTKTKGFIFGDEIMKVWILWIYKKENGIYSPVLWSVHKTEASADKEMSKHEDGFVITYPVKA